MALYFYKIPAAYKIVIKKTMKKEELKEGSAQHSGGDTNGRENQPTSGARYSGVPQKVFMVAASVMPSLQRPKSVIFMCPSLSSIRFSN